MPTVMQDLCKHLGAVQVHVFDGTGIGAGGSGAAAGLLHPFTPRGKVGKHTELKLVAKFSYSYQADALSRMLLCACCTWFVHMQCRT